MDGKIIDISGTMSGGGSNPARGGMTKSVQANSDPEALKKIALENNEIVDVCLDGFVMIEFFINFLEKERRASKTPRKI